LNQMKQRFQDASIQLHTTQAIIREQKEIEQRLKNENGLLEQRLKELVQQLQQERKKFVQKTEEVEELIRENQQLKVFLENERIQADTAQSKIGQRPPEVELLKKNYLQLLGHIETVKNENFRLAGAYRQLQKEKEDHDNEKTELLHQIELSKKRAEELSQELEQLEEEKEKLKQSLDHGPSSSLPPERFASSCITFPQGEVEAMTQNFAQENRIGEGRFGEVFKGTMGSVLVAVKRMSADASRSTINEIKILSKSPFPSFILSLFRPAFSNESLSILGTVTLT